MILRFGVPSVGFGHSFWQSGLDEVSKPQFATYLVDLKEQLSGLQSVLKNKAKH